MKAPFPYYGGKSKIADEVWRRFGAVPNYVEPFAGSLAVLLARPHEPGIETVNDYDSMLANYWRATKYDPHTVAHHADWIVSESDLHARHIWLVKQKEDLRAKLEGNPDYYDAKIAGWWLWGICQWIGSGWCSGEGPWQSVDGQLVHLGNAGQGINRKRVHLGDAGRGINRKREFGTCAEWTAHLWQMMDELANRLRRVRVCCGDWTRVCGPTPTAKLGLTGVFLDPPYSHAERDSGLYAEDHDVAADVRTWALEHGDDPLLRIAFCGYADEHDMPDTWEALRWKTNGGYGSQGNGRGRDNADREVIWFSPHCLKTSRAQQLTLAMAL